MGPLDLINHLLNFFAPAAWLAGVVTLVAHLFIRKRPLGVVLYREFAINFAFSAAILVCGLVFFGRDGKMATYTAMVLVCASSQWVMLRGWRA